MQMKNLILLLGILLISMGPSHARHDAKLPNPLLRFIAEVEGVREFALYSLITNRCNRYLSPRSREKDCHRAVDKMIDILDFDLLTDPKANGLVRYDNTNPHSFIVIAFKKSLIGLLNYPQTTEYLTLVREELNLFLSSETPYPVNLWDLSVKFWKSERVAAAAIAALFQDVSPVRMHLLYLYRSGYQGKDSYQENFSLLMQVLDTFQLLSDYSSANFQKVFYPSSVKEDLNKAFYHFYVPFYLSQELKRTGTGPEFAFTAPLMMTLTYEFITASEGYKHLYSDPKTLNPNNKIDAYKIRDIMAGFYGVSYAQGRKDQLPSFLNLGSKFGTSTYSGVEALLNHGKF